MSKRTSYSKTEISRKLKKIDNLFQKWYDKNASQYSGRTIPWRAQKNFLVTQLTKENLLWDGQLKDFWKAFDAACEVIPSNWIEFQFPLLKALIYGANKKTLGI